MCCVPAQSNDDFFETDSRKTRCKRCRRKLIEPNWTTINEWRVRRTMSISAERSHEIIIRLDRKRSTLCSEDSLKFTTVISKNRDRSSNGSSKWFSPATCPTLTSDRTNALFIFYSKERKDRSICLELGCGIGRVSKHLLSNYFDRLDINDLLDDYITQTKSLFEDEPEKIDRTFVCSIADIEFDFSQRYDLIWAQCR